MENQNINQNIAIINQEQDNIQCTIVCNQLKAILNSNSSLTFSISDIHSKGWKYKFNMDCKPIKCIFKKR